MPGTIYMMEKANLFIGDHDPSASNHLELDEFKLPDLEHATMEHVAGGAVMGIRFAMAYVMPMNVTFKLKGMNPERMKLFGIGGVTRRTLTAYGVIRDKRSNATIEAKAIIEGVITKLTPSSFKAAEGMDHDYEINEIVKYALYMDQHELFDIDFFEGKHSVGGVDQTNDINRILRIPGLA